MKRLVMILCVLGMSGTAIARPVPLQETSRFTLPEGYGAYDVAIEGSWIVVAGIKSGLSAVFLYERGAAGSWVLRAKLAEQPFVPEDFQVYPAVTLENGIAAIQMGGGSLRVFERNVRAWPESPVAPEAPRLEGSTIRVDGQRILGGLGQCSRAAIFEKVAGTWTPVATLGGSTTSCGESGMNSGLDISGDVALVSARHHDVPGGTVAMFRRNPATSGWSQTGALPLTTGDTPIALRGTVAVGSANYIDGTRSMVRNGNSWNLAGFVRPLDTYAGSSAANFLTWRGAWLVQNRYSRVRYGSGLTGAEGFDVYRHNGGPGFDHVARLTVRDQRGPTFISSAAIYERTAVAIGSIPAVENSHFVFVYDLPASFESPAPVREDYEGGGNAAWFPFGDAVLSLVTRGPTHVTRQSGTAIQAGAVVGIDWTHQSIQADLTPRSFTVASGYSGLVARYANPANYYYAALRNDNQLRLVKRAGSTETVIASAPLTVTMNRAYRVRLEARDELLEVYVDGQRLLWAFDAEFSTGDAGFITSRTRAEIDNVVVSPLRQDIFTDLPQAQPEVWTIAGGIWSYATPEAAPFVQAAPSGAARAITGVATDDQIVEARVRIDAISPAQSNWAGVLARYTNNSNLYYLSLRGNHQLQIRKVVGGGGSVLRSTAYPVTPGRFYSLRLDVIGDRLSAYVDGVLVAEVHDDSLASGRGGLATNNARATFASFEAYQP